MRILGIDFSSSQRSVALIGIDGDSSTLLAELTEEGTRETHAFHMIGSVLGEAGVQRQDVDALAIGLGPGSYGGIRVALSIAQGWQLATQVKTAGVESTLAIADSARRLGHRGALKVVVDAQRNEFYFASYETTDLEAKQMSKLRIASQDQITESINSGTPHFGPDLETKLQGIHSCHPSAASLAEIAGNRGSFVAANQLEPVYTRPVSFVKAPPARSDL